MNARDHRAPTTPATPDVAPDATPDVAPDAPPDAPHPHSPGRGPRPLRAALQMLGFVGGLAMLWWCASHALAPANRAQLSRLADASVPQIAALVALCVTTLILNGLMFWVALRPVHRLRPLDVIATNALATFLNYLPFKLSVISRVLIHNRRDAVPILTIGAWFAAVAGVLLAVYTPLVGVSLWRRSIDATWVISGALGVLAILTLIVLLSRAFRGEHARRSIASALERRFERFGGRALSRLLGTAAFARLHAGLDMLAAPRHVAASAALRILDIAVQAARFVLVASILSLAMTWQDATLLACTYFLIGVLSPAGQLGTREAGTAWLAGLLGMGGNESLAPLILFISAVESIVNLLAAGASVAWLRVDKLLRAPRAAETHAHDRAGEPSA